MINNKKEWTNLKTNKTIFRVNKIIIKSSINSVLGLIKVKECKNIINYGGKESE